MIKHSWYITLRHLRNLARQPWYIIITLAQPVIWLLLFGALFQSIADLPGFQSDSYIDFLAPGVVIMSALFSNGWSGMGMIEDIDRGVLDRFLITPVSRAAIIVGRLVQGSVVTVIQSVLILLLAWLVGARFPGGIAGIIVLILCASVLGASVSALSNGLALLIRREESVIAASNLILLPLTFLSTTFMQKDLIPGWMQIASQFNPMEWAISASRQAVSASIEPVSFLIYVSLLLLFSLLCGGLATRAFRSYQRSV